MAAFEAVNLYTGDRYKTYFIRLIIASLFSIIFQYCKKMSYHPRNNPIPCGYITCNKLIATVSSFDESYVDQYMHDAVSDIEKHPE